MRWHYVLWGWLFVLSAAVWAQVPSAPIVVNTAGEAQMFPDRAIVHFVLFAEGETLAQARQEVKKAEQNALNSLSRVGVQSSQVTMERFEVLPLQPSLPTGSTLAPKPLGYRIEQEYQVVLPVEREKLDSILQIADLLVELGARPGRLVPEAVARYDSRTRSQFLEFVVSNPQALTEQAVQEAIARARQLAQQMASQMGRNTVKLVNVSVNTVMPEPPRQPYEPPRESRRLNAWEPVKVQVQVTATFGIE